MAEGWLFRKSISVQSLAGWIAWQMIFHRTNDPCCCRQFLCWQSFAFLTHRLTLSKVCWQRTFTPDLKKQVPSNITTKCRLSRLNKSATLGNEVIMRQQQVEYRYSAVWYYSTESAQLCLAMCRSITSRGHCKLQFWREKSAAIATLHESTFLILCIQRKRVRHAAQSSLRLHCSELVLHSDGPSIAPADLAGSRA